MFASATNKGKSIINRNHVDTVTFSFNLATVTGRLQFTSVWERERALIRYFVITQCIRRRSENSVAKFRCIRSTVTRENKSLPNKARSLYGDAQIRRGDGFVYIHCYWARARAYRSFLFVRCFAGDVADRHEHARRSHYHIWSCKHWEYSVVNRKYKSDRDRDTLDADAQS